MCLSTSDGLVDRNKGRTKDVRRIHLPFVPAHPSSSANFISYLPVVSDQALAQPQLSEDVHHDLHGGVVGDGEGAHVQDRAQFKGPGAVGRQGGCMLGEVNSGVQHDSLLFAASIFC